MPYTPPSHHRSPAASAPPSPDVSRRPSFQTAPRPSLPRSASYLTKHRRTPSAVAPSHGNSGHPSPPGTSDDLKGMVTSASVRQSPPPVTEDRGMPKGAVISPPESASSGSDDDDAANVARGRRIENLRELKDAISQIPLHRESSPTPKPDAGDLLLLPSQSNGIAEGMVHSFSTGSLTGLSEDLGRRISHVRSSTDSNIHLSKSETSLTASDEESEDDMPKKPQMVRKKSGELVRPALRPPSRRRPSSMPGTPTFSKAVHFDSHLEHVRHFLQVDRPLAVSAGSSPVDNYDSDAEYPFPGDERSGARSPPYEWEIITANYPPETPLRKSLPVRLEKVWLSNDQKSLLGSVAVANLAFHKTITCRFTLDYWKTTSEVAAEYSHEIRPKETPCGHDRFTFTIKLSDLAHLETKTLFLCIRYNVNGQEYWDNNNGTNFQIDFRKKHLPQNGKRGLQGAASRPAGGLPRSNRRPSPSNAARPKSMPVGFDDFNAEDGKLQFDQPIHEYLGESGPTSLRLKTNKSTGSLASDNLSNRLSAPSGMAFANRYDFGASLTAAVQAAKDSMGKDRKPDALYMKSHRKISTNTAAPEPAKPAMPTARSDPTSLATNLASVAAVVPVVIPGTGSPNTSISSSSYEELVNKYCFFGSKQSSPQLKDGTLRAGRYDGADDGMGTHATNSTNSSANGSPNMPQHHAGPAMHHGLHYRDPNPYFHHANMAAMGGSPAGSPLRNLLPSTTDASSSPRQAGQAPVAPSTIRSASPAPLAGGVPPYAGTSHDFPYAQQMQERFPFSNMDAHAATAIRG